MFTLALEGIANNRMDYSKDPILPYIVETINQTVQKFTNIPKEEQDKLIALTDAQIEAIRNKDIRQRDEFLNNPPKIEGTLRTSPVISKIIDSWGTK